MAQQGCSVAQQGHDMGMQLSYEACGAGAACTHAENCACKADSHASSPHMKSKVACVRGMWKSLVTTAMRLGEGGRMGDRRSAHIGRQRRLHLHLR